MPKKIVKRAKKRALKEVKPELKAGYIAISEKTYFYQRKNGTIFMCGAKEASLIHGNTHFTQYGVSDGKDYCATVNELQKRTDLTKKLVSETIAKALEKEIKKAKGKLEAPPDMRFSQFGNNAINQSTVNDILRS